MSFIKHSLNGYYGDRGREGYVASCLGGEDVSLGTYGGLDFGSPLVVLRFR